MRSTITVLVLASSLAACAEDAWLQCKYETAMANREGLMDSCMKSKGYRLAIEKMRKANTEAVTAGKPYPSEHEFWYPAWMAALFPRFVR